MEFLRDCETILYVTFYYNMNGINIGILQVR